MTGHIGLTLDYSLVFNTIVLSDAGYYMCKAINKEGEDSNTTRVTVTGKTNTYMGMKLLYITGCKKFCH